MKTRKPVNKVHKFAGYQERQYESALFGVGALVVVLKSDGLYFQFVKKLDKLSDTGRSPREEVRTRFGVRLAKHTTAMC